MTIQICYSEVMLIPMVKEKTKRFYFFAIPKIHHHFKRLLKFREDKSPSVKFQEIEADYIKDHDIKID